MKITLEIDTLEITLERILLDKIPYFKSLLKWKNVDKITLDSKLFSRAGLCIAIEYADGNNLLAKRGGFTVENIESAYYFSDYVCYQELFEFTVEMLQRYLYQHIGCKSSCRAITLIIQFANKFYDNYRFTPLFERIIRPKWAVFICNVSLSKELQKTLLQDIAESLHENNVVVNISQLIKTRSQAEINPKLSKFKNCLLDFCDTIQDSITSIMKKLGNVVKSDPKLQEILKLPTWSDDETIEMFLQIIRQNSQNDSLIIENLKHLNRINNIRLNYLETARKDKDADPLYLKLFNLKQEILKLLGKKWIGLNISGEFEKLDPSLLNEFLDLNKLSLKDLKGVASKPGRLA